MQILQKDIMDRQDKTFCNSQYQSAIHSSIMSEKNRRPKIAD